VVPGPKVARPECSSSCEQPLRRSRSRLSAGASPANTLTPPVTEVPPPHGITRMLREEQVRSTASTSSVSVGRQTPSGRSGTRPLRTRRTSTRPWPRAWARRSRGSVETLAGSIPRSSAGSSGGAAAAAGTGCAAGPIRVSSQARSSGDGNRLSPSNPHPPSRLRWSVIDASIRFLGSAVRCHLPTPDDLSSAGNPQSTDTSRLTAYHETGHVVIAFFRHCQALPVPPFRHRESLPWW